MSNSENDIRLEQMSRDAASGYTPPGKASWEKMEAALDQVMPIEEKKRRRFLFWWLLPLVFIGAVAIYLVTPIKENNTNNTTQNNITKDQATSQQNIQAPDTNDTEKKPEQSTSELQPTIAPKDIVASKIPDEKKPGDTKRTTLLQQKNKGKNIPEPTVAKSSLPLKESNPDKKINDPVINNKQAATQPIVETGVINSGSALSTTNNGINTIKLTPDSGSSKADAGILEQKKDSTVQPVVVKNDTLIKDNNTPKTTKSTDSKFSFALVGGMDASTVKFRYSSKAGINAGFMTGYHFNETWSLHTGVLFTKKNYSMAGEDFHAPKGSWVANYKLTMVEGYCNMWEVPLLIRYKFNGSAKRGFFLSTGISSYFMTRENYNYSYYWNGQPITRNSNYPTGNTHLLSILKLSGGWRKSIGPGTSILIEPYAALPLSGLGYGSIRLSSFGLNFSLQLRQPYEKK